MMGKFDGVFILTDMDGTLLNSSAAISPFDHEKITYFIENGGLFSVATGRAKPSVEGFLPRLVTSAPSIVHNGSLITDLRDGREVRRLDIADVGRRVVEDVLDNFPEIAIEVCLADEQFVARGNFYSERHHKNVGLEYRLRGYEDIPQPWLKLNLAADHEILLDARELLSKKYGGEIFAQFSLPHYYEIMAPGASKGDSALWLRDYLSVREEDFYTVGDGTNDLELIRAGGKNSCATANAREIILENAAIHLPDNDSGAIGALIDMLDKKYR